MSARDDLREHFNECVESASIAAAVWVDRWLVESSDDELEHWSLVSKGSGFQLQRITDFNRRGRWRALVDVVEVAVDEPTIFYQRSIVKSLMRDSDGDVCLFVEVDMCDPHSVLVCGIDRW